MRVCLQVGGGFVSLVGGEIDHRRPLVADALIDLGRRYGLARDRSDTTSLLAIGQALYAWLDGAEGWLAELRPQLTPPFLLEVRAPLQPTGPEWAVLHAPWEVLADKAGFLAEDAQLRYAPARRLGKPATPPDLDDYRLGVAFMAAAPRGAQSLDFEGEEAAIMAAAGRDLDLLVEESGDPEELGRRLVKLKPTLPVLHLSCHGHNAWRGKDGNQAPQPVLMLEDAASGDQRPTTASELVEALGAYQPRLVFLSACLTAAAGEAAKTASEASESGDSPAEPTAAIANSLAGQLARQMPAVLGWDGSVADVAATAFARELYDDLGKKQPLPLAAANARRALLTGAAGGGGTDAHKEASPAAQTEQRLRAETEALKRDWHLARVWLGPEGGGPVVDGGSERSLIPPDAGAKHLLAVKPGERLEVADASVFVGRRRELKAALRFLAGREKAGLLLHGMGRLGKSSLAGRIIDRRPDLTPVVVFAAYDALSVLEALAKALEDHEPAAKLIAERRPPVRDDPAALKPFLVQLLSGPCKWVNDGGKPLLLLVDDLERVLEEDPASGRHRVKADVRPVLAGLLHAFTPQRSHSRLVLTSRYRFQLVEDGRDLADGLADLELSEFSDTSRRKLALRQIKAARAPLDGPALDEADLVARLPLLEQAQTLSRGNPGLQDLLGSDFVLRPAVPLERAEAVLAEMAAYLEGGAQPKTEEVRTFLQNLAIDALLELAGPTNQDLLRAITLFDLPVPEAALSAYAGLGGNIGRLRDLGLLAPAEDVVTTKAALAANGLAAGRLTPLTASEQVILAKLALPTLFALWGGAEGQLRRPYAADIELTRLALLAGDVSVLRVCAEGAVRGLAQDGRPMAAGALGQAAIAAIETAGDRPSLRLLARTAQALQTAGEGAAAAAVLAKGAAQTAADAEPADLGQLSNFLFAQGNQQQEAGDLDAAMATFERLCQVENRRADEHQLAIARGKIADILQARGELDEALRIRIEEVLPVFQRLGDVRMVAITQGQIADILEARGELDEALRIRTEEELPVYQRLGDANSVAVTQGQIADILETRGDLDEALRIRAEEELPVYQRLGDVRSVAITHGKIADILEARGELDEALRIRTEETLPVFQRLGDVREVALTHARIADIVQARGELDEALRIRTEEQLPVFRRLGDVRSVALTHGRIADILVARGELDEALRIRTEEQLPVFQRLGDVREVALTQGRIADILQARGKTDEGLALQEERLATYRRLGDVKGIAASLWSIAQIELERQQPEQAFQRLAEAWQLIVKLGQPDGIAAIGGAFGQFLAAVDLLDEARNVLGQAAAASGKLGRTAEAAQIEVMIADINKRHR